MSSMVPCSNDGMLPYSNQNIESWYQYNNYRDYMSFLQCIEAYVSVLKEVHGDLEKMLVPIGKFRIQTNCFKSVATVGGAVSASLVIAGTALAVPTAGTSLGLLIGGVVIAAATTTTSVGVGTKDYFKTKKFYKDINLCLTKLQKPVTDLETMLKKMKDIIAELVKLGVRKDEALTRTFTGLANGVVQLGQSASGIAMALIKIPMVIRNVETVSNVAMRSGQLFSSGGKVASTAGGSLLASVSPLLLNVTIGIGIAFTAMDIMLLVDSWKNEHAAAKYIQTLVETIDKEVNKWENMIRDVELFLLQHMACYNKVQHEQLVADMNAKFEQQKLETNREIERMRQEVFEREREMEEKQWERDMQQEQQERERRKEIESMRQELLERERQMEAKQLEREKQLEQQKRETNREIERMRQEVFERERQMEKNQLEKEKQQEQKQKIVEDELATIKSILANLQISPQTEGSKKG